MSRVVMYVVATIVAPDDVSDRDVAQITRILTGGPSEYGYTVSNEPVPDDASPELGGMVNDTVREYLRHHGLHHLRVEVNR